MSERVRSHACTRIAKLLSGHTKLERDLASDLLDARRERDEAREALADWDEAWERYEDGTDTGRQFFDRVRGVFAARAAEGEREKR